ncbi:MAG: lipid II flippase MurJ [Eubacteriales bacterium]|nr:lipid II flippase MurJ [Eubacteriales bacterium]
MNNKTSPRPVSTVAFMMAATVIAKALGMLRGMLTASRYGTGMAAQAFTEASHIPLTLFDLAFGAAVLGCFIPVYNSLNSEDGHADEFARIFLNLVLLVTTLLAVAGMIAAEGIIALMAPGFDAATREIAVRLLRVMFPMIIFTGSAYTLVGVMQSKGRYMLPAAVSAVSNAGVIVYLLFFDSKLGEKGIYGLAAAYVFSWFIQFMTLAIPLRASGFRFFSVSRDIAPDVTSALKKAAKMAPPIMVGSWLAPVGVLSGLYFASFIDVSGAVTVFDYSYAVYVIIAGTLTYSICNYAFPFLSRLGNGDDEGWTRVVRGGLMSSAAVILPCTTAVYILAGEGVALLYLRGEFTAVDVSETVNTLRYMATGMPAFAFIEIVSRVFYSKKNTCIPMTAALSGICINITASALLVGAQELRVGAVGLGNALGQTAAAAVLAVFLLRRTRVINRELIITLIKLTVSSLLSGAAMITVYRLIGNDPYTAGVRGNIICALLVVICGAAVYFLSVILTRAAVTIKGGNTDT